MLNFESDFRGCSGFVLIRSQEAFEACWKLKRVVDSNQEESKPKGFDLGELSSLPPLSSAPVCAPHPRRVPAAPAAAMPGLCCGVGHGLRPCSLTRFPLDLYI